MEKPKTRGAGAGSQSRRPDFSREVVAPPWTQGPGTPRSVSSVAKRGFDLILSITALVFFLPVFVASAIAVLASGGGPVLVAQTRTGMAGVLIGVLAFRVTSEKSSAGRVREMTRIGAFLRRTGIEDLPQLVNVVRGELSLVGPEARSVAADVFYSRRIKGYGRRFRVKPGMTGLAQVSCRDHGEDAVARIARRLEYDNAYIEEWSVSLDCKILLRAVARVFSSDADA